jgi:Pvc16 N-terminal domain
MSASTAVSGASKSLRNMLLAELTTKVPVTLQRPDQQGAEKRLNLFLHRVDEHPQFRNANYQLKPGTAATLIAPPLSLVLRYLMTAYATPHGEFGNADAHAMLGDAMRVFHQRPEVPAEHLDDSIADATESLRIMPVPLTSDEIGQLWATFKEPYELSVQYEVSVVQLDATADAQRPMAPRVREIGVPGIRAPYDPPRILDLQPRTAAAGTVLTMTGAHLQGWSATVSMSGVELAAGVALDGDSLEVRVPGGLPPGFHQVRADVSRLCRASFFVEVT